jgi:hypothetical protein
VRGGLGKKWFLALKKEHKLQVELAEQFITLHNDEICDLYKSVGNLGAGVSQSV